MDTNENNYANLVQLWQRCERNEEPDVLFFAIGHEELTTTGLKHRHLYIETTTKLSGDRWQKGKELLGVPDAHFESAKGTREQALDYAFKENPALRPFVYERIINQGETIPKRLRIVEELRTFKSLKDAAEHGSTDLKTYIATYPTCAEKNLTLRKQTPIAQKMKLHDMIYNWQLHLCELLLREPQERQIFWVESNTWGDGKSYCSNLIQAFRQGQKLPSENLNIHHLIGLISNEAKTLIFDLPRNFDVSSTDFCNTLEELSNHSILTTSKYAGRSIFVKKHLVVFSNSRYPNAIAHKDIMYYELNKPTSTFTFKKMLSGNNTDTTDFEWESIPFIKENF